MFRQEVNKYKQKSFDLQSTSHHPSNSLLQFMNRTQKATRVQTDNTDSKSNTQDSIIIQASPSQIRGHQLYISRAKSKSVIQGNGQTPDTPDGTYESMSIHHAKYAPSKFKLSANQLANQQDSYMIEDFSCFQCKNISDQIKECVGCGHLFCQECINTSDNACFDPECNFTFEKQEDKRNLFWDLREPSKIIHKKINQLQFKCLNEQLGCDQIFDIKNYRKHVDEMCDFMLTECPNRTSDLLVQQSPGRAVCQYVGPKKFMNEHLQSCNQKMLATRDFSKFLNEDSSIGVKRFVIDEFNTNLNSSQEESNIFDRTHLQQQNSDFASKIMSIGDEYVQSQMDEIIDLNKKLSNQSIIITKQAEQIDKQQEDNRKLKDQIDKLQKDTDVRISQLQASSTQMIREMQWMKKNFNDKIDELLKIIKQIKGDQCDKSMEKSQSEGMFSKLSYPSINNSLINQSSASQTINEKSEQSSAYSGKCHSSSKVNGKEVFSFQPQEIRNLSIDVKNQQIINPKQQASLFSAKLVEINSQNGENSNRNKKYSGNQLNEQYQYQNQIGSQNKFSSQIDVAQNKNQHHRCKTCFQQLIYTPLQFLNVCINCNCNKLGNYYCKNCPTSRFYCIECCPLLLKRGYCPNFHGLCQQSKQSQMQQNSHKCNLCDRVFSDNNNLKQFSCLKCDFDICAGCLQIKYIDS